MKLNLGCGYRKIKGFINIDMRTECDPDLVHDLTFPLPYEDSTVDEIHAVDILEHIPIGKTVGMITDIWRVLKNKGLFFVVVPSTDGRGAFQDPTHVSFWNRNSWLYFMDDAHRDLYNIKAKFFGKVHDQITSDNLHIIHTYCELYAVK